MLRIIFYIIFSLIHFCFSSFILYSSDRSSNCCNSCKPRKGLEESKKKLLKLGGGRKNAVDWNSICNFRDEKVLSDKNTVLDNFFNYVKISGEKDINVYINNLADILRKSKIGFCNVGNTCYLNSSLQVLLRCKEFIVAFLMKYSENYTKMNKENKEFFDAFLYLILKVETAVRNNESYLDSGVMKYVIGCFGRVLVLKGGLFTQNDSSEFITYFIDYIGESLKNVTHSLYFNWCSTLSCINSHRSPTFTLESIVCAPFSDSIQKSIDSYSIEEKIDNSTIRCGECFNAYINSSSTIKKLRGLIGVCNTCKGYKDNYKGIKYGVFKDGEKSIYHCEDCGCIFNMACNGCQKNHYKFCRYCNIFDCEECRKIDDYKECTNNVDCIKKRDKIYCEKCRAKIYSVTWKKIDPCDSFDNKYFFICLKRYASENNKPRRIGDPVKVDDKIKIGKNEYVIRAVIVQSGGLNGGHYYSYVDVGDGDNSEWFKFNDSSVTNETNDGEKDGYLFLYERC